MRCCLTTLVVLVVLAGVVAAWGFLYLKAPEMRPVATYLPSLSWDEMREGIPFLRPSYVAQPPLSPEMRRELDALIAGREKPRQVARPQEEAALTALRAAGLPVSDVRVLETAVGEPILTVALDYEQMASGTDPGRLLAEGVRSFTRAVEAKSVDLSGMSYLTVAVRDDEGRILVAVTGKTGDIEALRAGTITRTQFLAGTAAQIQSREAALDFIGKVVR